MNQGARPWSNLEHYQHMAKKKKSGKKKVKKGGQLTPAQVTVFRGGMDRMAQAYFRLLLDPCNAPLAYPVFGGSDGTYLAKFESFLSIGIGGVNGFIWWSPGTTSQTAKSFMVAGGSAVSTTVITWATAGDLAGSEPGAAFLRTAPQAASYRCIAACMEVMTLDAELNRQGQLAIGTVSNSSLYGLDSSVDQLMPLCQSGGRMPDSKVEAVWRPSEGDTMFLDATDTVATQQVERRNGLLLTWAGASATTSGLRVKFTSVVEWKPRRGTGITAPSAPDQSGLSFASVSQFAAKHADSFVRWAPVVGRVAYNYMSNAQGPAGRPRYRIRDDL